MNRLFLLLIAVLALVAPVVARQLEKMANVYTPYVVKAPPGAIYLLSTKGSYTVTKLESPVKELAFDKDVTVVTVAGQKVTIHTSKGESALVVDGNSKARYISPIDMDRTVRNLVVLRPKLKLWELHSTQDKILFGGEKFSFASGGRSVTITNKEYYFGFQPEEGLIYIKK